MENKKCLVVLLLYKENLDWLKEAIDSVLGQTYKNFDLVISRCSYDGDEKEIELLNIYKDKLTILTVPAKVNVGVSAYVGSIDRPSEYFAMLASHDLITPDFLEKHIANLEANKNYMWSTSWIEIFGSESRIIQIPDKVGLAQEKTANYIDGTSVWRRKIWDKHGGYSMDILPLNFHSRVGYPDWDFWVRLLKEGYEYGVIKEPLFKYRRYEKEERTKNQTDYHKYLMSLVGENNNILM